MTQPAKHTPGPWVIRNKDAVYAQSGRFIADCELTPYGSRPQPPNSTDEANAHLVAAAPAMYEALRMLITLDPRCHRGVTYCGECGACMGQAALAQAEARS